MRGHIGIRLQTSCRRPYKIGLRPESKVTNLRLAMQSASHELPNTQLRDETEPYSYNNDKFSQDCDPDFTQLESMFTMAEICYVHLRTPV